MIVQLILVKTGKLETKKQESRIFIAGKSTNSLVMAADLISVIRVQTD